MWVIQHRVTGITPSPGFSCWNRDTFRCLLDPYPDRGEIAVLRNNYLFLNWLTIVSVKIDVCLIKCFGRNETVRHMAFSSTHPFGAGCKIRVATVHPTLAGAGYAGVRSNTENERKGYPAESLVTIRSVGPARPRNGSERPTTGCGSWYPAARTCEERRNPQTEAHAGLAWVTTRDPRILALLTSYLCPTGS
jgi:hypothetical protein